MEHHAQTREDFTAALRRLKQRLRVKLPNLVLELRVYTHCHAPHSQHYDFVIYSNLPQDELRRHLRRLWVNAGGREDIALVEVVDPVELVQAVGYQSKSQARYRTRFYLPERNGLAWVWGTTFFVAESKRDMWQALRDKWFPTPQTPAGTASAPLENKTCVKAHTPPADPLAYFAHDDRERAHRDHIDRECISHVLRTTPAGGLSTTTIAHRSGSPIHRVERLLKDIPNVKKIDQWQDADGKLWNSSGWFKDEFHLTADQWRSLSEEARILSDLIGVGHAHMLRHLARQEYGPQTPEGGS